MNGILGTWDLFANINQAVYTNSFSSTSVVTVNLCNRGNNIANVRIAVATSATAPTNAEWIAFNVEVPPKQVYEKMSILVPAGKSVVVRSNSADVNAVCYGITNSSTAPAGISRNFGTAPTFTTSSSQTVKSGEAVSLQLATSNEEGETVTYAVTSGTLPSGLTLSSSGLISGTVATAGYPSGDVISAVTITATDSRSQSTPQLFNITRQWKDGSSSGNAAPNAQAIKAMTGTTTNGAYWIDVGTGPVQTYCLMSTATGYMLAAKIATYTFDGPNDWGYWGSNWFRTTSLNEAQIANNTSADAVGPVYYNYRMTTGFAMALNTVTNVIAFNYNGTTPRQALAGTTSVNLESQLSRSNFMTWITNAGTASSNWDNQPNANKIRLNSGAPTPQNFVHPESYGPTQNRTYEIPNVGLRFGIAMNNEADDTSCDSSIGFGTFTNGWYSNPRHVAAGGHRWNGDQRFNYPGFIFVH